MDEAAGPVATAPVEQEEEAPPPQSNEPEPEPAVPAAYVDPLSSDDTSEAEACMSQAKQTGTPFIAGG